MTKGPRFSRSTDAPVACKVPSGASTVYGAASRAFLWGSKEHAEVTGRTVECGLRQVFDEGLLASELGESCHTESSP